MGENMSISASKIQGLMKRAKGGRFSKGDPDAQWSLGLAYANGVGVEQDSRKAAELYLESFEQRKTKKQQDSRNITEINSVTRKYIIIPESVERVLEDKIDRKGILEKLNNIALENNVGDDLLNIGEYLYAEAVFDFFIGKGSSQSYYYFGKAEVLYWLKLYNEALGYYVKAIKLDPKNVTAYRGKAECLYEFKLYLDALNCIQKALEISSDDPNVYFVQGKILLALNKQKDANDSFGMGIFLYISKINMNSNLLDYYFKLGTCYEHGWGIEPDLKRALDFYMIAANQGFPNAQFNVANMYEIGTGLNRDLKQAKEWYQKAEDQRNVVAQRNIEAQDLLILVYDTLNGTKIKQANQARKSEKDPVVLTLSTTNTEMVSISQSDVMDIKKQFESQIVQSSSLIAKDSNTYDSRDTDSLEWKEKIEKRISMLDSRLNTVTNVKRQRQQTYIDSMDYLREYQDRIKMEFDKMALSCFLADGRIFQIAPNKTDLLISTGCQIPKSIIAGIPLIGPVLSKIIGPVEKVLRQKNESSRLSEFNRVRELFNDINNINKISDDFSRFITLAKMSEIRKIHAQKDIQYQRLGRIEEFYRNAKKALMQCLQELGLRDQSGVQIESITELAILDCAYLFKIIFAGEFNKNTSKILSEQMVEVITGILYQEPALSDILNDTPRNVVNINSPSSNDPCISTTTITSVEEGNMNKEKSSPVVSQLTHTMQSMGDNLDCMVNDISRLQQSSKTKNKVSQPIVPYKDAIDGRKKQQNISQNTNNVHQSIILKSHD